jgi:hypothetical protein
MDVARAVAGLALKHLGQAAPLPEALVEGSRTS